ncbi:MAG: hypothetical protein WCS15_01140 [Prevotella sp.]|nr:hypothetical protein [Prevotella sp.]MDD3387105.1 hypothetical protein [Prevotella sp.]MDD4533015.1 hypothetical protein [Prevotella sp.]MDT3387774.1 hypothetical protein [Bacteroidota bacterium]
MKYKGAVSITTWCNNEAHVTCTWNPYVVLDGENLMIHAAGMTSAQTDITPLLLSSNKPPYSLSRQGWKR